MRRIAIINQKGGVGKTTTTVNVGAALARAGFRVLVIDLDPQAHASLHLGLDPTDDRPGIYHLLTDSMSITDTRVQMAENLWVIGASIDLAAAEVELVSVVGREVILRDQLDQYAAAAESVDSGLETYDYVLMDCPPSLGVLTLNGLCAAKEVLIPLQPHYLALQGLSKLLETVALVSKRINPELTVTGVVICMRDAGTKLGAEVVEDVRSFLEGARQTPAPWRAARLFNTQIRRNIKLAEAPSYGQDIFNYALDSNGANDYATLAAEVHDPAGSMAEALKAKIMTPPAPVEEITAEPSAEQSAPIEAVVAAEHITEQHGTEQLAPVEAIVAEPVIEQPVAFAGQPVAVENVAEQSVPVEVVTPPVEAPPMVVPSELVVHSIPCPPLAVTQPGPMNPIPCSPSDPSQIPAQAPIWTTQPLEQE
ncbi:MAG: AAA family ATPase [Phycisphaerae bacterium]|nr:AAA family ATPase [Phycisphaerae bacterium]